MINKLFRVGDEIGPDYRCSFCNLHGFRLWRQSHTFLGNLRLLCAVCAEREQVDAIKQYAYFHQETDPGIGDLVPARPTPEGDTFWGHTSGDVLWWYKLPQYKDAERESEQRRIERDHNCEMRGYAERDWLKALEDKRATQDELDELKEKINAALIP